MNTKFENQIINASLKLFEGLDEDFKALSSLNKYYSVENELKLNEFLKKKEMANKFFSITICSVNKYLTKYNLYKIRFPIKRLLI